MRKWVSTKKRAVLSAARQATFSHGVCQGGLNMQHLAWKPQLLAGTHPSSLLVLWHLSQTFNLFRSPEDVRAGETHTRAIYQLCKRYLHMAAETTSLYSALLHCQCCFWQILDKILQGNHLPDLTTSVQSFFRCLQEKCKEQMLLQMKTNNIEKWGKLEALDESCIWVIKGFLKSVRKDGWHSPYEQICILSCYTGTFQVSQKVRKSVFFF